MKKIQSEEISAILLREIEHFDKELDIDEVGTVLEVGDGIARVYGLSRCMAGEMLDFGNDSPSAECGILFPPDGFIRTKCTVERTTATRSEVENRGF